MARLIGERFVSSRKVVAYLLDTSHVDGASKAHFFLSLGFSASDHEMLVGALSAHPVDNDLVASEQTACGVKSVVQCRIETLDGRNPCIRTVWIRDTDLSIHRLVTAYPAKG